MRRRVEAGGVGAHRRGHRADARAVPGAAGAGPGPAVPAQVPPVRRDGQRLRLRGQYATLTM